MDCNTARLFLQLGRPGSPDLAGEEVAELENHLAQCAACGQLAHDQDRLDQHLSRAMRDVPVPVGLKEQVLLRLDAERGAMHRRWGGRAVLGAAAAAALLLGGWGVWYAFSP